MSADVRTTIPVRDTTEETHYRPMRRTSWGAIFAGVVIVVVVHLLLGLLGIAVGASTVDPATEQDPTRGLGIGTAIWLLIVTVSAMFAGGWTSAHLAGVPQRADSVMHGVVTWSVATMAMIYLATTAVSSVVSGAATAIGRTLGWAGKGIAEIAPEAGQMIKDQMGGGSMPLDNILNEAKQLLRQTGQPAMQPTNLQQEASQTGQELRGAVAQAARNPEQGLDPVLNVVKEAFKDAKSAVKDQDREALVNALMERGNMSRADAERTVDGWIRTAQDARRKLDETAEQAKEKGREVADVALDVTAKVAGWSFVALVIGAAAAAFGGALGMPGEMPEYTSRDHR